MIPPPALQERAYESDDQARSCISSRSPRPSDGGQWAVNKQVVRMISRHFLSYTLSDKYNVCFQLITPTQAFTLFLESGGE